MNTPLITAGPTGQSETVFTSLAAKLPRRSRWGGDLFVMAIALAAAAAFVAPIQHNTPAATAPATIGFSTPDRCLAALTGPAPAAQDASCAWPAFTGPAELPWSAPAGPLLPAK